MYQALAENSQKSVKSRITHPSQFLTAKKSAINSPKTHKQHKAECTFCHAFISFFEGTLAASGGCPICGCNHVKTIAAYDIIDPIFFVNKDLMPAGH